MKHELKLTQEKVEGFLDDDRTWYQVNLYQGDKMLGGCGFGESEPFTPQQMLALDGILSTIYSDIGLDQYDFESQEEVDDWYKWIKGWIPILESRIAHDRKLLENIKKT